MSNKETTQNRATPLVSEELLRMIVCPISGCALELNGDELVSRKTSISYKIIDGIPILVAEENEKDSATPAGAKKYKKR
jgi:uncharacterized protein YbaR (Trm112 family)